MAYDLHIRPEAEWDIQSACDWYDDIRDGLGQRFFLAVYHGHRDPDVWQSRL